MGTPSRTKGSGGGQYERECKSFRATRRATAKDFLPLRRTVPLRRIFSSSPLQLPPLPVEAAGAAGVLTTPMASADHRLAALVAAFAFAQVRSATLAVVRPGRAALSALLPQQQLFLLPSLPPPSFSPQAWSASCFATESASMVS